MRTKSLILAVIALSSVVGVSAAQTVRIKNLKVLAAIYRGTPGSDKYMSDHDVTMCKNGLEVGRAFYYRNSLGRLNIQFDFQVYDAVAPDNTGPTMKNIEADVRARGVKDGDYDGMMATGVGMSGNWGGFNILGGAGGCFGGGGRWGTGYPGFDPDTGYGWAWMFTHEFQHAFDLVIVESSDLNMIHAHPYADHNEPDFAGYCIGGEHWDWIAFTFREFNDYLKIKGVRNDFYTCTDADGDGFADDDARLPMDEKRFGSSPDKKDTDGDGLDDLHEFTADRFAGSNPLVADTDGDGMTDDVDPYPVVAIRPTVAYAAQQTAPVGDKYLLVDSVFARNDAGGDVRGYASWNEDALTFTLQTPQACKLVNLKIDGSATNGFWEGGDTYVLEIKDGKVALRGLGLNREIASARVVETTRDGSHWLTLTIPARLGQGVSKEINYGGKREPQDVADGLTLVNGRAIGLNILLTFVDGTKAYITPHHSMYATRLLKPADAPDHPLLRAPAQTAANPVIANVLGVGPQTTVRIVDATDTSTEYGARIGPGPVQLIALTDDGDYELIAKTDAAQSVAAPVRVDRTAAAPAAEIDGLTVTAACEPRAEFEVWWGIADRPAAPVAGGRADDNGQVTIKLGDAQLSGWVATAYNTSDFTPQAYVEAWPKIDRHFEGGAPDPRLGADDFSYNFEGYIDLAAPDMYTFELNSDDGSRLFIDDDLVLNYWGRHEMTPQQTRVYLPAGLHRIRIAYQELDGWAGVQFRAGASTTGLTLDVPVRRTPVSADKLQFFAVQVDPLGNRSDFAPVVAAD